MSQKNPESHNPQRSKYAVSLVTFNGEKELPTCLESIDMQSLQPAEYIVYDNNSQDESMWYIQKYAKNAQVIASRENNGFARAHNEVIRNTVSEYILILNQDVVLNVRYSEELVRFLDEHDDVAAVTGKILRVVSLEALTDVSGIDACGISISQSHHATLTHSGMNPDRCTEIHEVFGVPATCALYRRSALEDCAVDIFGKREYFDEDFFMYKEDVDLAYRLRLRGWKSYCLPQVGASHIRTAKSTFLVLKRGSRLVKYWSYRNHWYLLIKNLPKNLYVRVGIQIILYELAKCVYMLIAEPYSLTAVKDIRKHYVRMLQKRTFIQARTISSTTDIMKWMQRMFS